MVEIKIGIQHSARELTLETDQTAEELEKAISAALAGKSTLLTLADEKGRKVIIPIAKVAYVEIAESTNRPFGFTTR